MDLDDIYRSHPLSHASISARLSRQGLAQSPSEWHLAIDPDTNITDQNHSGGAQAVLELGIAAGVDADARVIDVGAGLGGSARVLAAAFGCRVTAVDRDRRRCDDAAALTALVHLDQQVAIVCRDAFAGCDGLGTADVLWGQSAWSHFDEPTRFLDLWLPCVAADGRVAMSDSFVGRPPRTAAEATLIRQLEDSWGAHLVPADEWIALLETRGFRVCHQRDRSDEALTEFKAVVQVSRDWPEGLRTDFEAAGWSRAIAALESGLIRSVRLVARRP